MLRSALQLMVVITPDWKAVQGELRCFEKSEKGWVQIGEPFPANVGRNGLGWGLGLHDALNVSGPFKREGDNRAPAGIFALGSAYGYAPMVEGVKLPYLECDEEAEWVDDPVSRYYNRFVKTGQISDKDWTSSEKMRREDDLYSLGLFVKHNCDPVIPYQGSCIFMHVWRTPQGGSAGCTIMEKENMRKLLQWLDPEKSPLLVQLPKAVYMQYKEAWQLP